MTNDIGRRRGYQAPRALLLVLLLADCANLSIQPPATPTPTQIGAFGDEAKGIDLTPAEYVSYGITKVEQNCITWFGNQIAGASETTFGQQILSLGMVAAGAAGGPIGAGVAAGGALVSGTLGAAQSNRPAGAMPAVVYTIVDRELQAYVAARPEPRTKQDAVALVQGAAKYCQGPSIAGAVMAALMTVPVATVWAPANFSAAAPVASRVVPPVVVVGTPPPNVPAPEAAAPRVRLRSRRTSSMSVRPIAVRYDPVLQQRYDAEWVVLMRAFKERLEVPERAVELSPPSTEVGVAAPARVETESPPAAATPAPEETARPEPPQAIPEVSPAPPITQQRRRLGS